MCRPRYLPNEAGSWKPYMGNLEVTIGFSPWVQHQFLKYISGPLSTAFEQMTVHLKTGREFM